MQVFFWLVTFLSVSKGGATIPNAIFRNIMIWRPTHYMASEFLPPNPFKAFQHRKCVERPQYQRYMFSIFITYIKIRMHIFIWGKYICLNQKVLWFSHWMGFATTVIFKYTSMRLNSTPIIIHKNSSFHPNKQKILCS